MRQAFKNDPLLSPADNYYREARMLTARELAKITRQRAPGEHLPQARSHVLVSEVNTWPSRRELDFG